MIFLFCYPSLLLLYFANLNEKYSLAYFLALSSPVFFSIGKKYMTRYELYNKSSFKSDISIEEFYQTLLTFYSKNYKSIKRENNTIFIRTQSSFWSLGEIIKIKAINEVYFVDSQFPSFIEFLFPDVTGIHHKNVKKIEKLFFLQNSTTLVEKLRNNTLNLQS